MSTPAQSSEKESKMKENSPSPVQSRIVREKREKTRSERFLANEQEKERCWNENDA